MKTNSILIVINILGLIGALIWLMVDKSWEPLVTTLGLIGSLIALIYSKQKENSSIKLYQKGGKNSTNYQSARDININKDND